jgi:hypothetical protein
MRSMSSNSYLEPLDRNIYYAKTAYLRVEQVIKWCAREARVELLLCPILKSGLLVVEEDTAILDSRFAMGASTSKESTRLSHWDIGPPVDCIVNARP